MFGWGDKTNIYKPKERLIYHYWDGKKKVKADPLTLYKRMMEEGPSLNIDMTVANSHSKDAVKAHESMIVRIRKIFDLVSYSDGGLTELESIDLLDHFLTWCEGLKKNSKTLQKQSTCTEDCKTSSKVDPLTPNLPDSGLTEKELVSAEVES